MSVVPLVPPSVPGADSGAPGGYPEEVRRPLTREDVRRLADEVQDPRMILALAWGDPAYLRILYWRRVEKDSARGASGSKSAHRRVSVAVAGGEARVRSAEKKLSRARERRDGGAEEVTALETFRASLDDEAAAVLTARSRREEEALAVAGEARDAAVKAARKTIGAVGRALTAKNFPSAIVAVEGAVEGLQRVVEGAVEDLQRALAGADRACALAKQEAEAEAEEALAELARRKAALPAQLQELRERLERREGAVRVAEERLEAAKRFAGLAASPAKEA